MVHVSENSNRLSTPRNAASPNEGNTSVVNSKEKERQLSFFLSFSRTI